MTYDVVHFVFFEIVLPLTVDAVLLPALSCRMSHYILYIFRRWSVRDFCRIIVGDRNTRGTRQHYNLANKWNDGTVKENFPYDILSASPLAHQYTCNYYSLIVNFTFLFSSSPFIVIYYIMFSVRLVLKSE